MNRREERRKEADIGEEGRMKAELWEARKEEDERQCRSSGGRAGGREAVCVEEAPGAGQ